MEEAKKMTCYKRLIFKKSGQVSGLCGPQFLSYLPKRFTHLCRALYGDAILKHRFGAPIYGRGKNQKHLEFTFSTKVVSFHSRTSIRADKHIFWHLKWLYCWKSTGETFFSTRQNYNFGVTHCDNLEVQIAVFSKWSILRKWKLVQRFTFCLSST